MRVAENRHKLSHFDGRTLLLLPDLDKRVMASQEEIAISIAVLSAANETPVSVLREEDEKAAEAWMNFVKDYAENSEVIESAWTCVSPGIVQSFITHPTGEY